MPKTKKQVRAEFRHAVFSRDKYQCIICKISANPNDPEAVLDAHHVTNRSEFPNGGYVKENGVSLCKVGKNCHLKAEDWLNNGIGEEGLDPQSLYAIINSSREKAEQADKRLSL